MKILSAKYLTSVTDKNSLLCDNVSEFAFVGRSNVGKSSMINSLLGQKKLARASSSPGLTKMINYFDVNNGAFRFVDLPGYGYHKAGKANERLWSTLIEDYLNESENLKTVFMLVDSRIGPTELDIIMRNFLIQTGRNFMVIATKTDKLSSSQKWLARQKIANSLSLHIEAVIMYSSLTHEGREQILSYIENLL